MPDTKGEGSKDATELFIPEKEGNAKAAPGNNVLLVLQKYKEKRNKEKVNHWITNFNNGYQTIFQHLLVIWRREMMNTTIL